jgi:hypothetical protein
MTECHEMNPTGGSAPVTIRIDDFAPEREKRSQIGLDGAESWSGAQNAPERRQADTTGATAEWVKCVISNLPLAVEACRIGDVFAAANPWTLASPHQPKSATKQQQARRRPNAANPP